MPEPTLAQVFAALASDDRLALLRAAEERRAGMTIAALARVTDLTRFAASRHLRVLEAAGLVVHVPTGRAKIFHLSRAGFDCIEDWLLSTTEGFE